MEIKVHPKVIENLGKLPRAVASRFLRKWFTRSEEKILKDKAGCLNGDWEPYGYKNLFLI